MKLSREEVLHIAALAKLGMTEDDIHHFGDQLSNILENFEVLKGVDLEVNKDSPGLTTSSGVQIDTKHIKTKVAVENGGTVVIGNGSGVTLLTINGISIGEPLTLNGGLTISSSSGGAVSFLSTINSLSTASHAALVITTTGVTSFQGNVGAGVPLGGVTVNGGGMWIWGTAETLR